MITREDRDVVSVLQISHGKANALDLELLRALAAEMDGLSTEARALVLTGSEQMFSAGLDLPTLVEGGSEHTCELIDALHGLLARFVDLPIPSVAAINGHAIAGGFLLAAACDVRLMAMDRGKVGLTELLLGVPFPPLALEIVRAAVGDQSSRRMILHGELFSATAAEQLGLVDELVAPATLLDRAVEIAERLGSVPRPAFELTKRQMMVPLRMRLKHLGEGHEEEARQAWMAEETVQIMRQFVRDRLG